MTAPHSTPFNILVLCTGNSARSILAEYLICRIGAGRFQAYSAGARPSGTVHPLALRVLRENYQIDASDARSKSWDEFKNGPTFDFVITVCDNAKESCPIWPGQPIMAHWGSPDPAAFEGTEEEKLRFFKTVALQIQRRIELFASLPLEKLDKLRLAELTRDIGASDKMQTSIPS
jgi:arsenate reductase (thioredoxin)